jgi:hypothetical protein
MDIRDLMPPIKLMTLTLSVLGSVDLLGQTSTLTNGTLTIGADTRVTFMAPIELSIGTNASIVNNGILDLREGRVVEPIGSPITGSGTETAYMVHPGGDLDSEPGGLGLRLSGTLPADSLIVERGHQPIVVNGTIGSVGRWFELNSLVAEQLPLSAIMRVDPTELNGIDASSLELHRSSTVLGPWTPLPSVTSVDPLSVSADIPSTTGAFTAFEADIMTSTPGTPGGTELMVWPTASDDVVNVRIRSGEVLRQLELFSLSGERVALPTVSSYSSTWSIPVGHLASGVYILRVNGTHHERFLRP